MNGLTAIMSRITGHSDPQVDLATSMSTEPRKYEFHATLCTYPIPTADLGFWRTPAWSLRMVSKSLVEFWHIKSFYQLTAVASRPFLQVTSRNWYILLNSRLICSVPTQIFLALLNCNCNFRCEQLSSRTTTSPSGHPYLLGILCIKRIFHKSARGIRKFKRKECAERNRTRRNNRLRHAPKTMLRMGACYII